MSKRSARTSDGIPKSRTGIRGLDEITHGGLPRGRPTLVCGGAGCGKTMFAVEFLVRGAVEFDEPGVFMAFEETAEDLIANVKSLGFQLDRLVAQKKIVIDHVHIERSEIAETGEFDLEGLFVRLDHAVRSVRARRVALDTVEALFAGLSNDAIIRAELRRLFRWLKDRGLTTIITGERGEGMLTRYGLEEYVADCVILLDSRVKEQITTRRLNIIKYRGSAHGTNEYPFLISEQGVAVLPITSLGLDYPVSSQRVSSGIKSLDEMLSDKGYFRGSSILVSGAPGTGKSSVGIHLLEAACRRGERALLFAYEESGPQILRNMRSMGIKLDKWIRNGRLRIHATRPTLCGLERHLIHMNELVEAFKPSIVVVDPISNLSPTDDVFELKPALTRLVDFLKTAGITALFTSLHNTNDSDAETGVSSLMDTWLLLRNDEINGERQRTCYVLKSRGMAHSNRLHDLEITSNGVRMKNRQPQ